MKRTDAGLLVSLRLIGVGIFEVRIINKAVGIIRHHDGKWVFNPSQPIFHQDQANIENSLATLNDDEIDTHSRDQFQCRCNICGHIGWGVEGMVCNACGFCKGIMERS